LEKDEESENRDMVKNLNKREFESEMKKKLDRDDNKNHNIEMQVFKKNQNKIDVNLIVSAKKEEEKNIDAERVPIFNTLNKNIFSKKCLMLKKSTKKNATFYLNEEVMKNLTEKNKTNVFGLFERLDFDFIKEKKNKKNYELDENCYKQVKS